MPFRNGIYIYIYCEYEREDFFPRFENRGLKKEREREIRRDIKRTAVGRLNGKVFKRSLNPI